jgi:hypothetical protein
MEYRLLTAHRNQKEDHAMATLIQAGLDTTVSGTVAQLVNGSDTGWSVSGNALTLTPPAGTVMPAIYIFQIDSPAGYQFDGGTGLTWGTSSSATFGIVTYTDQAYLVAIDDVTGLTGGNNSFTLNLISATNQAAVLDPTVSFNPPG